MNPLQYHQYLQLDKILDAQELESLKQRKKIAHDEHLFIIVHQAYELWFKQILFEIQSILEVFEKNHVDEKDMGTIVFRLDRVHEIFKLLSAQIEVIETMTPLDFLDFRDLLYPASGFQSFQFRKLELRLGLSGSQRLTYNQRPYYEQFEKEQKEEIQKVEKEKSLFDHVEAWLLRMPFLKDDGFDFWSSYKKSVITLFKEEKEIIKNNQYLNADSKEKNESLIDDVLNHFESLFDLNKYNEQKIEGHWRLAHKAIMSALLIHLYRDQPLFQLPFRFLQKLTDIDEAFTQWRYRHALMAKRMLGQKIGTGGSSGHDYLKAATEQHRIFTDFVHLTTFFIPRKDLPPLPENIERRMGFQYNNTNSIK